jgi:norsolorinic acid ketoreductase
MVATDMGHTAAKGFGSTVEEVGAISPDASATGVLSVIDKAGKETHGGKFWDNNGEELSY